MCADGGGGDGGMAMVWGCSDCVLVVVEVMVWLWCWGGSEWVLVVVEVMMAWLWCGVL